MESKGWEQHRFAEEWRDVNKSYLSTSDASQPQLFSPFHTLNPMQPIKAGPKNFRRAELAKRLRAIGRIWVLKVLKTRLYSGIDRRTSDF
jgi:hypothetical protein